MRPKVVTFDAANTLVEAKWTPGGFAIQCAQAIGLDFGDQEKSVYEGLVRRRWAHYQEINKTRDPSQGDAFWMQLAADWMEAIGETPELASKLVEVAPDLLYGDDSVVFRLYEDIVETLDALDKMGIRTGVISNWDYSLHRVLKAHKIHHRFEHVIASLEEGVEKPDPRLFHLVLEKFGVTPDEALHVGDDPLDDFRGAQDAGMRAYLIDRRHPESNGAVLARMTDLIGRL